VNPIWNGLINLCGYECWWSFFYNLIKDMYKISAVCVKVGKNPTDSFESSIGVRQGDVLNPNLFKICINDLPDYL
jgi:hypothetical protein